MQRSLHSDWPVACPECETELSQATGVCPACRWTRTWPATQTAAAPAIEGSYADRYYGTEFADRPTEIAMSDAGMARGRLFLIVGAVAVVLLGIAVSGTLGFV